MREAVRLGAVARVSNRHHPRKKASSRFDGAQIVSPAPEAFGSPLRSSELAADGEGTSRLTVSDEMEENYRAHPHRE